LYHTFKLIDTSNVPDRQRYAALVRAQLSAPVLIVLTFNCLSDYGRERFKLLVEKFALLEHVPDRDPIPELLEWYDPAAKGARN
jgi:hypothetical protein